MTAHINGQTPSRTQRLISHRPTGIPCRRLMGQRPTLSVTRPTSNTMSILIMFHTASVIKTGDRIRSNVGSWSDLCQLRGSYLVIRPAEAALAGVWWILCRQSVYMHHLKTGLFCSDQGTFSVCVAEGIQQNYSNLQMSLCANDDLQQEPSQWWSSAVVSLVLTQELMSWSNWSLDPAD